MDNTSGQLTTGKLQFLLDVTHAPAIGSRRDLANALADAGEQISIHGVEAWFRHVDSNYNLKRESLAEDSATYLVPKRRWPPLLKIFGLQPEDLRRTDAEFQDWCLEARRARSSKSPEAIALPTELAPIGQKEAWSELSETMVRAASGHPTLVTLSGIAGVGKTHLLNVLNDAGTDRDAIMLRAVCAAHTQLPLIPIIDMFRNCREALLATDGHLARQFNEFYESYVESPFTGFESPQAFLDLVSLVSDSSRRQLVVLLLDDLHLADDPTARFLDYLWTHTRAQSALKLMIVVAHRPSDLVSQASELIESLQGMTDTRSLELHQLNESSLKAMLDDELDWPLTKDAFTHLWQHSFGLPAQALEALQIYRNRGKLFPRNGYTELESIQTAGDSTLDLRAIYRTLLKSLTAETRELLNLVSCVGIGFKLESVQLLKPHWTLESILDAIAEAERLGILIYDRDKFQFKSAAMASALYDDLGGVERARMHLDVSRLLQARGGMTQYEIVEAAHHMRLAGPLADPTALTDLCQQAAFSAARLAAWPQVIQFAETVLDVQNSQLSDADRGRLRRLVASAWHQSGNPDDAIRHLLTAVELFKSIGDEVEHARTLNELVRIRGNFGRLAESDTDIEELLRLSETLELNEPRLASRVFDALASRMTLQGKRAESLEFALKAKAIVADQPPSTELALASIAVAIGYLQQHGLREAREHLEDAHTTALQINDRHTTARVLQRLTLLQLLQGRFDETEITLERLRILDDPLVHTGELSIPLSSMISVCALQGRGDEARILFDQARNLIDATGYFWSQVNVFSAYCHVLVHQDKVEEAFALIEQLYQSSTARSRGQRADWLEALIRITLATDDNQPDINHRYATPPGEYLDATRTTRYCADAEIALAQDDQEQLPALLEILQRAFDLGARFTLGWPFCLPHQLARILLRLKRPEAARYNLIVAHQLCTETGSIRELKAIKQTFAQHFPSQVITGSVDPNQRARSRSHLTLIKQEPTP